ncbi:helix-turn-helix domain-containing protein [Flavobacterium branchiicola]|uniref:Helix-turn-helix domain-containing protein n=1 Tax=Flavobacterium branchiicola TaxID=1114875 RepID=A0ABV9PHY1_9FLAO|nr:AraC family transcriptional regulator [Flavobacterium branchiicola]MBS7255614.1 helix-turn-helix transcriptional regulator [Flavobacterium branchiicola]
MKIELAKSSSITQEINEPYYIILIFDGHASFSVNLTDYECEGKNLLFLSPYQLLKWNNSTAPLVNIIRFHGDFYCIEYHKKEVACNGILFNDIYSEPFVTVSEFIYDEIISICERMQRVENSKLDYDNSILKSYLQVILALSSKEKQLKMSPEIQEMIGNADILTFQSLLEKHFLEAKEVAFYASKYNLTVNTFSKRIKKHFGKPPTKLIQERIVLEAKKLLHLTVKTIREIALDLNFEDEFYFSRYFKNSVGVSPKEFRKEVGISIVAK